MNLLLFSEEDLCSDGLICVEGRRHDHINNTLCSVVGDRIRVGLINGKTGTALVEHIGSKVTRLVPELTDEPPMKLPVRIIIAMSRPKSMRKVLRYGTAMGVSHFAIINSWRADKSYWQSPLLFPEKIRSELLLSLEQACDTGLPHVTMHKLFKPFVEDELPQLVTGSDCFTAHPYADVPAPFALNRPISLAIGPEGGFIPYEVELLQKTGFTPVSMGRRILRVENAVPALIGRLFV
ncbi:MAG: 16S rRNA (uracil(1498)-N(3))-methyltransferase [Spirochaetes bacterium]|jgi:16S rRNA (uracil1498-N3)-methyltransferase|nr:16S rRNA (uracil(1498)-N(3))-methyltransferase [Spirochaetota bacterium]